MTNTRTQERETKLRSLAEVVPYFDWTNPVHLAHWGSLKVAFGEMGASMLVSQDAHKHLLDGELELTDPGAVGGHAHWAKLNRVVRHGEKASYTIFDFEADTKVGGRVIPLWTREQTDTAQSHADCTKCAERRR